MKIAVLKGTSLIITSLLTTTVLANDSLVSRAVSQVDVSLNSGIIAQAEQQANSNGTLDARVSQLEQKMSQVRTQTALGAYGAQTASARPQNEGCGLFFHSRYGCMESI